MKSEMSRAVGALLMMSALTAAAPAAFGQATGRVWVAFNGAAAGSPTSIAVDRGASTEDRTVFNVSLSGYYVEQVIVPGVGTFQKVSLPEDEEALLRVDGKPGLPILGMLVGIPTDAPGVGQPVVTVLESQDVDGILVYPTQPEAIEEPGNFPVVPFTQDAAAYLSRAPYPAADSQVGAPASEFMGLKVQSVQVNPFRYVPSTRTMTIRKRLRVEIPHNGAALPPVGMTRRTASSLSSRVDNWASLATHVTIDALAYKGCYLILTPQRYLEEIEPLAHQKRERGFNVVIRTTESTGNSVAQIKAAIQNYADTCTSGDDHYVLLVGDVNDIPLASAPVSGNPSDHAYACLDAGDWPDVWLGRFSVDSEADLTTQVTKTLTYEDNPPSSTYYDDVELIAHRQVENGYIACMQDVAAFSGYVPQPTFTLRAGTSTAGTNANVITDIEAGRHIVMYRG
ncbi:MAG: C25 family cysteine peptidase, partial [Phycisphaerales bacterium]